MPRPIAIGDFTARVIPGTRISQDVDGLWRVEQTWQMHHTQAEAFRQRWSPGDEIDAASQPGFSGVYLVTRPETTELEGGEVRARLIFEGFRDADPNGPGDGEVQIERWSAKKSSVVIQPNIDRSAATYAYFHDVVTFEYTSQTKKAAVVNSPDISDPDLHSMEDAIDSSLAFPVDAIGMKGQPGTYWQVANGGDLISGFVSQEKIGDTWRNVEYHTKKLEPIGGGSA